MSGEQEVETIRDNGWTYAEKKDFRNYEKEMVLLVNTGKLKTQTFDFLQVERGKGLVCLSKKGERIVFKKKDIKNISVCKKDRIMRAPGDKIMSRSGAKGAGLEVVNREILTFKEILDNGKIETLEGKTLPNNHITYGYASTSHKSQGSSFKTVIIGMDRHSMRMVDQKLAYVAGTRGKFNIKIIVEEKSDLLKIEDKDGNRKYALELHAPFQKEQEAIKENVQCQREALMLAVAKPSSGSHPLSPMELHPGLFHDAATSSPKQTPLPAQRIDPGVRISR